MDLEFQKKHFKILYQNKADQSKLFDCLFEQNHLIICDHKSNISLFICLANRNLERKYGIVSRKNSVFICGECLVHYFIDARKKRKKKNIEKSYLPNEINLLIKYEQINTLIQ